MSVAFDDQGEIVPSRGVTRTSRPPPGRATAGGRASVPAHPYVTRRSRTVRSAVEGSRVVSTKCQ